MPSSGPVLKIKRCFDIARASGDNVPRLQSSFISFCKDRIRQGIAWSGNSRGYSV